MSRIRFVFGVVVILALGVGTARSMAVRQPEPVVRVSVASDGAEAERGSASLSLSADGRYAAFASEASNLVEEDTNDTWDIFVRDCQEGTTTRVSVDSKGEQGNGKCLYATISADGRYVGFSSRANNLVEGDTNRVGYDAFVHDRQTGKTTLVSLNSEGEQAKNNGESLGVFVEAMSADGRYVVLVSDVKHLVAEDDELNWDVFVHDRQTGETTCVSMSPDGTGERMSYDASISHDGRYVVFTSSSDNLVAGDTNKADDVFVHDRETGKTVRVSVSSGGDQRNGRSWDPAISADGRYVAFASAASNLVEGDTNGKWDIFVHDCWEGTTARVSVGPEGREANGSSVSPIISANGRYVGFDSSAGNLVAGVGGEGSLDEDRNVFVHDRQTGETVCISIAPNGVTANDISFGASISRSGRYVAFVSEASNLVSGDTNEAKDSFMGYVSVRYSVYLPLIRR